MILFTSFNLLPSLQSTLREKEFVTATEIQQKAIPILLEGRSLVGVSETGSGKTLSYVLPILHLLKTLENNRNPIADEAKPRAVVIVPTRELGEQVTKVFKPFTHTTRLRVRSALGGSAMDVARRNVQGCFEVLVATPGRVEKLLENGYLDFSDVRTLVFDEADQMLDQGFLPSAKFIAGQCPENCQMVLFSATVSSSVQKLMNELFSKTEIIRSGGSNKLVPSLMTKNIIVKDGKRFPYLESLLGTSVPGGTMIFTNTREQCDKLALELKSKNIENVIYRGEMDKVERRANLKSFREGKIGLMISTDLASRGLDIDHVGRVVNYHMPQVMDNYIHRVGRTARAGRKGLVVNFVTERDLELIDQLGSIK